MPVVTMRQLLEAGVHFGHQTRRWNPKMQPYIFGERNGIYIIDLQQTLAAIERAYGFVRDLVADDEKILFVGTKKQAQEPVESHARRCRMPYVNFRWLGGMLTNFETIRSRVEYMNQLEAQERAGEFDVMPKKEGLRHRRELEKLQRALRGIRTLERRPGAVFVIDTKREEIAIREASRLGISVVAVVDTNCDPDMIDYVIPGNDDAIRSATLMCRIIADGVEEGGFVASRRDARPGATEAEVAELPPLDPEQLRRKVRQQARARAEAAAQQAERERRLRVAQAEAAAEVASERTEGGPEAEPGESDAAAEAEREGSHD